MRGDVQNARRFQARDRFLCCVPSGEQDGFREERVDRTGLGRRTGQRREVHRRAFGGGRRPGFAEQRIGHDHDRGALACRCRTQSQEIAAAGQVTRRVALDQVTAVFADEGFEWHQVEIAVRGDEQPRGIAERLAQGAHDPLVQGTRVPLQVGARRIA